MPQGSQYMPLGKLPDEYKNRNWQNLKKALDESGFHQGFTEGEGGQQTIPPGEMKALLGAMASRDPKALAALLEKLNISPEEFVAMVLERDESEGLTFDVDEAKLSTAMETIKAKDSPAKSLGQALSAEEGPAETQVAAAESPTPEVPLEDRRVETYRELLKQRNLSDEEIAPMLEEYRKTLEPEELPPVLSEIDKQMQTYRMILGGQGIVPGTPEFDEAMATHRKMLEEDAKLPEPTPTPETPVPEAETPTPADVTAGSTGEMPVGPPPQPIYEVAAGKYLGPALDITAQEAPPSAAPTDVSSKLKIMSDILSGVEQMGEPAFNAVSAPNAPGGASGIDQAALLRMIAESQSGAKEPMRLGQALALGRG